MTNTPAANWKLLWERLGKQGDFISTAQRAALKDYCDLLHAASARTNLIAPGDREEIATRHLLPSLYMGNLLRLVPNRTAIDFGSGSGIPGIPLKIVFPAIHFILVESRRKRANFLRNVVRQIGLTGVEIENCRIEDLYKTKNRIADVVVTRAASDIENLWTLVSPVLKDHGVVLATLDRERGYQHAVGVIVRQEFQSATQTHWFAIVR